MTLQPGTRIGSYEILGPLGAGGMGEVYRARDGKLDRDVAVKVLPAHLTADPDSLARFEREAKAVAALSHPNILSIFDFGSHEGVSYAVTELLQGETLRGKLDGSTVTQRQAVDWSRQIAKGLSAAHGAASCTATSSPTTSSCRATATSRSSTSASPSGSTPRRTSRPARPRADTPSPGP